MQYLRTCSCIVFKVIISFPGVFPEPAPAKQTKKTAVVSQAKTTKRELPARQPEPPPSKPVVKETPRQPDPPAPVPEPVQRTPKPTPVPAPAAVRREPSPPRINPADFLTVSICF